MRCSQPLGLKATSYRERVCGACVVIAVASVVVIVIAGYLWSRPAHFG